MVTSALPDVALEAVPEEALVARSRERDELAVRELTRRYNRRLFRLARGIVRDDAEAEDVVQEAYVRAFTGLARFRGHASFGTWLTRIAINEALGRRRRQRPETEWNTKTEWSLRRTIIPFPTSPMPVDPERHMARRQMTELVERAIDALPEPFRVVFIARAVEGMSVEETARTLGLRRETVKTRVHRARLRLRAELEQQLGQSLENAFAFDGARCQRLTDTVVERLGFTT
jgi:RNA polymerase sigma-70 factor (ECF subfamily)